MPSLRIEDASDNSIEGTQMVHNLRHFAITLMLLIALSFTFELQAHAYVDPGSGLLIFQGISATLSGALFYLRRHLKNLFVKSPERISQSSRPLPSDGSAL
jgi:hypothetical protein